MDYSRMSCRGTTLPVSLRISEQASRYAARTSTNKIRNGNHRRAKESQRERTLRLPLPRETPILFRTCGFCVLPCVHSMLPKPSEQTPTYRKEKAKRPHASAQSGTVSKPTTSDKDSKSGIPYQRTDPSLRWLQRTLCGFAPFPIKPFRDTPTYRMNE